MVSAWNTRRANGHRSSPITMAAIQRRVTSMTACWSIPPVPRGAAASFELVRFQDLTQPALRHGQALVEGDDGPLPQFRGTAAGAAGRAHGVDVLGDPPAQGLDAVQPFLRGRGD